MKGKDIRPGDWFCVNSDDDTFWPGTYFVLSVNEASEYNSRGDLTIIFDVMWVRRGEEHVSVNEMIVKSNKILTQCVRYFEVVHTHDT